MKKTTKMKTNIKKLKKWRKRVKWWWQRRSRYDYDENNQTFWLI